MWTWPSRSSPWLSIVSKINFIFQQRKDVIDKTKNKLASFNHLIDDKTMGQKVARHDYIRAKSVQQHKYEQQQKHFKNSVSFPLGFTNFDNYQDGQSKLSKINRNESLNSIVKSIQHLSYASDFVSSSSQSVVDLSENENEKENQSSSNNIRRSFVSLKVFPTLCNLGSKNSQLNFSESRSSDYQPQYE